MLTSGASRLEIFLIVFFFTSNVQMQSRLNSVEEGDRKVCVESNAPTGLYFLRISVHFSPASSLRPQPKFAIRTVFGNVTLGFKKRGSGMLAAGEW